MSRVPAQVSAAALLLFLFASLTACQSTGEITGVVTDSTGALVVGAGLRLANDATGAAWSGAANEAGQFRFSILPPGAYSLTARRAGFADTRIRGIAVEVNRISRVDVAMQAAATSQEVKVVASAQLLDFESSVLWALEASGQADNTVLVFTSDHGEMLGSHSLSGKRTFYEESIRVPMLLRVPFRHQGGTRESRLVSQIDLVPTLLDLMGKKAGEGLPGESWRMLLEGESRRREDVIVEWHTTAADRGSIDGMADTRHNGRAVITPDGWKLGLYESDNCLLFHRDRDPLELDNLYYRPGYGPVIRKLRARIEEWQKEVKDSVPLPEPAS